MKSLLLLFLFPITTLFWNPSPDGDLEKLLKKAQELEQQRKFKSAAELALKIQAKAREADRDIIFVQAVEIELKANKWFSYDSFEKVLNRVDEHIRNPFGRTEPLLRAYKIHGYRYWYDRHSYKLRGNADDGVINDEPRAWSKHDIWKLIDREVEKIKAIKGNARFTSKELEMLTEANEMDGVMPSTVKDWALLTAIKAIKAFDGDYQYHFKAAYEAQERFVERNISIKEAHPHAQMTRYFAMLLDRDQKRDATLQQHMDLLRLKYIYQKDEQFNKIELYRDALKKQLNQPTPASSVASAGLAEIYASFANQAFAEEHEKKAVQWQKKAIKLCKEALKKYPKSYGALQCQKILDRFNKASLQIEMQAQTMPGKPIPIKVYYKNQKWVKLRAFPISAGNYALANHTNRDLEFPKAGLVWEHTIELPQEPGSFRRDVIDLLPELPKGFYWFEVEAENKVEVRQQVKDELLVNSTNLALITQPRKDHTRAIALNRASGKIVDNCRADFIDMHYNYRTRERTITVKAQHDMKNGTLDVPRMERVDYFQLSRDGDTLVTRFSSNYYRNRNSRIREDVVLFADRSIYRPGQVIHFKGIASLEGDNEWKPNKDKSIEVRLIDVNRRTIAKETFYTNDYGSFQGQFKIPEATRPGTMHLQTDRGRLSFEVQYYKRPVFDAKWEVKNELTKPGEDVEVALKVASFAGAPIANANIETTVKLSSRIFKYWYPQSSEMVVARVNDTTGADGMAGIRFQSMKKKYAQTYTIESKVSLPDGSSRSFDYTYIVAPRPVQTGFAGKQGVVSANRLPQVFVKGINGEEIQEDVRLEISQLEVPENTFYSMPFTAADHIIANEKQWSEAFPGMAWNNSLDMPAMPVDQIIEEINAPGHQLKFPESLKLDEGFYKFSWYLEDTVYHADYLKVLDPGKRKAEIAEPLVMITDQQEVEPGQRIDLYLSSRFEDAQVRLLASDKQGQLFEKQVEIDGKKATVTFDVQSRSEGKIHLSAILVAEGREFTHQKNIKVKPLSRALDVHMTSIRSEIVPGQKEKWTIQVQKNGQTLENAEVLASMYDISLDQFVTHQWSRPFQLSDFYSLTWRTQAFQKEGLYLNASIHYEPQKQPNWYIKNPFQPAYRVRSKQTMMMEGMDRKDSGEEPPPPPVDSEEGEMQQDFMLNGLSTAEDDQEKQQKVPSALRTNFNETAFFYPMLKSEQDGNVVLKFEAPQSMTSWKLQVLAIDTALAAGYIKHEVKTQKPLMVIPNKLRFVHHGDEVTLEAMAYNMTDSTLVVKPSARFTNAATGETIPSKLLGNSFTLNAGASSSFAVRLKVPENLNALNYQVSVTSGAFTDGELHSIPVLPSRQRVINSMVIWNKPGQKKTYKLTSIDKLQSPTAAQHKLTIEMTTNPVWMALKALPAVYRAQSESAIQLARNFYVTANSSHIMNEHPEIQRVLKVWAKGQPEALRSSLKKNKELRNLLLGETPWEEVAANEEMQRAVLIEMLNPNFTTHQIELALSKLESQQLDNGAFSWRPGMRASFYFTLQTAYYLSQAINLPESEGTVARNLVNNSLQYLKNEVANRYDDILRYSSDTSKYVTPSTIMRYFQVQYAINKQYRPAGEAEKFFYRHSQKYQQLALQPLVLSGFIASNFDDQDYANLVIDRLRERAVIDEEKGIFWRENGYGWRWDEAPITTQAIIINFFEHMQESADEIEAMKLWLVRQKQGQAWRNHDASLMAIDALFNTGKDWLKETKPVTITIGRRMVKTDEVPQEAGTGYFKQFLGNPTAGMKTFNVDNPGTVPVWGALYHSFTEDFANMQSMQDEMSVKRTVYRVNETGKGQKLEEIEDDKTLTKGERIRIQITLKSNRKLDYVWVKSPHAACMEPVNQMSGYQWDGGISFYAESHDSNRRYFMDQLNNGTYILSYDMFVVRPGSFRAGPVEVQSAYAPEFGAHTGGYRINVK